MSQPRAPWGPGGPSAGLGPSLRTVSSHSLRLFSPRPPRPCRRRLLLQQPEQGGAARAAPDAALSCVWGPPRSGSVASRARGLVDETAVASPEAEPRRWMPGASARGQPRWSCVGG